jgi:DNA-binding LacI/PurR family transcriptional regulator
MHANAPKSSMADIARIAEVSLATVSMALADHPSVSTKTKERILEISRQVGYQRKAPSSASGVPVKGLRYGFVDMAVTRWDDPGVCVFQHLSRVGISQNIRFEYLALPVGLPMATVLEEVKRFSEGLNGLIITNLIDTQLCEQLRMAGIIHLALGYIVGDIYHTAGPAATTVAFDDMGMSHWLTRHLLESGHTRIAFVAEMIIPGVSHDRWLRGYRHALADAGIPWDPALAQVTGQVMSGAGPALDILLKLPAPPTAFVVPDKRIAYTLVDELRRRGIESPAGSIAFVSHDAPQPHDLLSRHIWVIGRAEVLGEQIISQLDRLRGKADSTPVTVLAPFDVFNLPRSLSLDQPPRS